MTVSDIENQLRKLRAEQLRLKYLLDENILPGLEFYVEKGNLVFDTSYFDKRHGYWEEMNTPLSKKLAYEVDGFDFPISKAQGKKFCEFMEFSDEETEHFLKSCDSDEFYQKLMKENFFYNIQPVSKTSEVKND